MAKGQLIASRSHSEWIVLSIIAAFAAWLVYFSVARTLAYTLRAGNTDIAYAMAPGDGRIKALMASKLSGPDASTIERQRADTLARQALQRDPTVVTAASVLGLNTQILGDAAGGKRWMEYSQKLSRRDLQAQLWALEDAVSRGNVPEALRHYDIALRTSKLAPDILYPVLASAIKDEDIREALARTLAHKPLWTATFLDYAVSNSPNWRALGILFGKLARADVPIPEGASAAVIDGLRAGGDRDAAWDYYASTRAGAKRNQSRDPSFMVPFKVAAPFDWNIVSSSGAVGSFQRGVKSGIFDFAAPSSMGGAILRQVQMLPPGHYRITGHSVDVELAASSLPYWGLSCSDGKELGRVVITNSVINGGNFDGFFDVPNGCPEQALTLFIRPSDSATGAMGQLDRVMLRPAQ